MYKFPIASIKEVLRAKPQASVAVSGWIQSIRSQKSVVFAQLNDGTNQEGLQLVLPESHDLTTGASVSVTGKLVELTGRKQAVELMVSTVQILGRAEGYPLHKGRLPIEFLRSHLHLRPRTRTFGAVNRVRSHLTASIHSFFKEHSFMQTMTPILTGNDCEGGGDVFRLNSFQKAASIGQPPQEFFGKPVYTTVSGQLHLEFLASSMSRVYTLNPAFRAERSDSRRHLAEFWMLEAEMAFMTDLGDLTDFIEASIRHSVAYLRQNASEELEFFNTHIDKTLLQRLDTMSKSYTRLTYTDALKVLLKQPQKLVRPVSWGSDLKSEHEKFLADYIGGPVFITDYPKSIKPFYTKESASCPTEGKTAACLDLIVPGMGEVVGGSLREDNYEILKSNMENSGMNVQEFDWYLDLRRYGAVPLAGYGLGFERLLGCVTGIANLRDLIPAPRYMDHCPL